MILAISLAGIICAGALIPVTQVVVAYQESEADLQCFTTQNLGGLRIAQLTGSLWREADPPKGYGTLNKAASTGLSIGSWELYASGEQLLQSDVGGMTKQATKATKALNAGAVVAEPVHKLAFTYLLDDGTSVNALKKTQFDQLVGLRYHWRDPDGQTYVGLAVPTDCTFAGRTLALTSTKPPKIYRRSNYEQQIQLSVKPWK
jgi:hypothetical protein